MKLRQLAFSFLFFTTISAITTVKAQTVAPEQLVGTWNWKTVIDPETGDDLGLDRLTMGLASEIKTEFKKDNNYVERKLKPGSTEYSTTNGEWKLEEKDILSLKAKDKWRPATILKMSGDSLLLQMNPKMNILMIKQK